MTCLKLEIVEVETREKFGLHFRICQICVILVLLSIFIYLTQFKPPSKLSFSANQTKLLLTKCFSKFQEKFTVSIDFFPYFMTQKLLVH